MASMMLLLTHVFSILNQWNQAKASDVPWQVIKDHTTYNPLVVALNGMASHVAMPAALVGSSTTPARTATITLVSQAGAGQPLKQSVATMSTLLLATTSHSHPTTTAVVGLASLLANLPLLGLFTKGHCQATKNPFISIFLIHLSFLMYYQLLTTLMLNLLFRTTHSLPSTATTLHDMSIMCSVTFPTLPQPWCQQPYHQSEGSELAFSFPFYFLSLAYINLATSQWSVKILRHHSHGQSTS